MVTLFSPSVYDHVTLEQPRVICSYLPLDSVRQAKRFLNRIKPAIHITIRHDIWPNYQWLLNKYSIPSLLVDASISDERWNTVKKWPLLFRQLHATFDAICTVSELNSERFSQIYAHPERICVCGDTRYDRVYERAFETEKIESIRKQWPYAAEKCLIAGSTWPGDEKVIFPAIIDALKTDQHAAFIVAPHETTSEHVEHIITSFRQVDLFAVTLSQFEQESVTNARVLVIDRIGLLANLYALGAIAYVGGGFGAGVHNVLEPAAHGCVIAFGPRHLNSPEAKIMVTQQVGTPVFNSQEFFAFLREALKGASHIALRVQQTRQFVQENMHASQRTADVIEQYISKKKKGV